MDEHDALAALEQWGEWARRGSGSVGWPQDTALGQRVAGRVTVGQGWQSGGYDEDAEAFATDKVIATLPRELRRVLVAHYVDDDGDAYEVDEHELARAREAFSGLLASPARP